MLFRSFLFMHFLHFHRPLPEPNPLQWPFIGLVLAVITLQSVATVQTWRIKRKEPLRPDRRAYMEVTKKFESNAN